jgi:hypothetical protein
VIFLLVTVVASGTAKRLLTMSENQYAWCTQTGAIVDAHDLVASVNKNTYRTRPQHEFRCLDCDLRMYLHVTKASRYNVPGFFAHEASQCGRAGGGGTGESATHYRSKFLLQQLAGRYKFLISECRDCHCHDEWEAPEAGEVVIEKRAKTEDDRCYAYDAAIMRNGKVHCALEVYHTHKTTREKVNDTRHMGIQIAEFLSEDIIKMHSKLIKSRNSATYVLTNVLTREFTCNVCRIEEETRIERMEFRRDLAIWRREMRRTRELAFNEKESFGWKIDNPNYREDKDKRLEELSLQFQERSEYALGRLTQIRSCHATASPSEKLRYTQILRQREAAYQKMQDWYLVQMEAREVNIKLLRLRELEVHRDRQYIKAKKQRAENVYSLYPYLEGQNFKCICRRWIPLEHAVCVSSHCMTHEQWCKIPSVVYKKSRGISVQLYDGIVCMQCSIACERCERTFLLNDSLVHGLCFACNKQFFLNS